MYCSMVEIEMKRAAVYCSRVGMATVKVHTRHTAGSEGTHDWKRRPIFALCVLLLLPLGARGASQLKTPTSVAASSSDRAIAVLAFWGETKTQSKHT